MNTLNNILKQSRSSFSAFYNHGPISNASHMSHRTIPQQPLGKRGTFTESAALHGTHRSSLPITIPSMSLSSNPNDGASLPAPPSQITSSQHAWQQSDFTRDKLETTTFCPKAADYIHEKTPLQFLSSGKSSPDEDFPELAYSQDPAQCQLDDATRRAGVDALMAEGQNRNDMWTEYITKFMQQSAPSAS